MVYTYDTPNTLISEGRWVHRHIESTDFDANQTQQIRIPNAANRMALQIVSGSIYVAYGQFDSASFSNGFRYEKPAFLLGPTYVPVYPNNWITITEDADGSEVVIAFYRYV